MMRDLRTDGKSPGRSRTPGSIDRRNSAGRRLLWSWLAGWLVVMSAVSSRNAWAQSDEFNASLRAGEFATALQIANSQPDAQRRARQLGKIASMQAAIGERGAMIHTLTQQPGITASGFSVGPVQPTNQTGNSGGGALADFDPLIDLITSTVEPDTWSEVGGAGEINSFAGGVLVDADGLLRRAAQTPTRLQKSVDHPPLDGHLEIDVETEGIRKVSLPKWEQAVFRELAMGRPVPKHLQTAGIQHITYLMAYPEQNDLVIAGPACRGDAEGISLSDIAVIWHAIRSGVPEFGCSIDPLPQNLVRAQQFLQTTSGRSIRPAERRRWLAGIRDAVGPQEVRVFGLDADMVTARTLVEADYHMKLVGIGLEPAPQGVDNYLKTVKRNADGTMPPLEVLRWWFTLSDQPVQSSEDRLAFRLPEQTVRVQSENELLDMQGTRQGTGTSSAANTAFARSFTKQFLQLADAYPIYARLRSVFDITFAVAVIEANDLTSQVGWQPTLLVSSTGPIVQTCHNARRVETVINHRVIAGKHIVAAVSGGVIVRPGRSILTKDAAGASKELIDAYRQATPQEDVIRWSWK